MLVIYKTLQEQQFRIISNSKFLSVFQADDACVLPIFVSKYSSISQLSSSIYTTRLTSFFDNRRVIPLQVEHALDINSLAGTLQAVSKWSLALIFNRSLDQGVFLPYSNS